MPEPTPADRLGTDEAVVFTASRDLKPLLRALQTSRPGSFEWSVHDRPGDRRERA